MTGSTQFNIVRQPTTPLPGSTTEERTEALEKIPPSPLNNTEAYQTVSTIKKRDPEADAHTQTIYGSTTVPTPSTAYTLSEREQRIDAYAHRVKEQKDAVESGSQGERNIKFQRLRQFMEPSGYFSGGLLAAGYDPHEKIDVTFISERRGIGSSGSAVDREPRTYFAWEIAAGALKHDRQPVGGPINYTYMTIGQKDTSKVKDLEALGNKLQGHWEHDISTHMRDPSGTLAKRSGEADAYVVRGTLQSLHDDKESFAKLSPEGQQAVIRTLTKNGQVIIPNLYGYPLAGYAFIPYTPYDGNPNHRPNKGLMIDIKNGSVSEIHGDTDAAAWAEKNRANVLRSFNAGDMQGGTDNHWPQARHLLKNFTDYPHVTYPGYNNLLSDRAVPVRETFNYTEARGGSYQLKYDNLNNIASKYQDENAKNALWADQTGVFGKSQQDWKDAKDLWGSTFGYVPVVGSTGNIVFGIHDAIYGKTAGDRLGGSAAAAISSLQLAHDVAQIGTQTGLNIENAERPSSSVTTSAPEYKWQYNDSTNDFYLARTVKNADNSPATPNTNTTPGEADGLPPDAPSAPAPPMEVEGVTLPDLSAIDNSSTGGGLFSTPEKAVVLSGEVNKLSALNEKLYTFVDMNKKGSVERLNILVHGSVDPDTGIAKVSYNGKLNTPQELLNTLHKEGIYPEKFDNVRLLSCDSASGGDASFANEFQKLIGRPVKGYSGTLTANLAPENITAAVDKVYTLYADTMQKQGVALTPALQKQLRGLAEQRVATEMAKISKFKPAKSNPHWNPFKWWAFTYKPVTFPAKP